MKIKFGTIWLAYDGFLASDLRLNGKLVVQESDFLRAANATFYARGNRSVEVSFRVTQKFDTLRLAEEFMLSHVNDLPNQADAVFYCGTDSDVSEGTMSNATLVTLPELEYKGLAVTVLYKLIGGIIGGIVAVEHLDEPSLFTLSALLSGATNLTSGTSSVTVSGATFPSVPVWFTGQVLKPAGGANLLAFPIAGSQSTDGFSFDLSADVPSTGYQLMWSAKL
jgi:hypothetical protein